MNENYLIDIWKLVFVLAVGWHGVKSESMSTLDLLYCPDSVRLAEPEPISSLSIGDFLSLTLGYSLPKPLNWKTFDAISNVFALPKASITVRIYGQHIIHSNLKFPILQSDHYSIDSQFDVLSERTKRRFSDNNRIVVKIDSPKEDLNVNEINGNELLLKFVTISAEQRYAEALKRHELKAFISDKNIDKNDPIIKELILEMETIYQILDALKEIKSSNENLWPIRGVFWFEIKSLASIESQNWEQSLQTNARTLVSSLIQKLTKEFRELYDNKVIVTAIEDKISLVLVRKTRKISESNLEKENKENTVLNLGHNYDPNFHTAFAMVGFTTLLIALLVFGISVSMWNIDPGKDSIIYRMTSQRIKKDQ